MEQQLNQYAEAVKPGSEIINAAVLELRQKQRTAQKTTYGQSKRIAYAPVQKPVYVRSKRLASVLAVAAAFVVIVVSVLLYNIISNIDLGKDSVQPYAIADLTYRTASREEIESGFSILLLDTQDIYSNSRIYSSGSKTVAVSTFYKTVGSGGLDEIVVIADIEGKLTDYKDFKHLAETEISGAQINLRQTLENGEYYTDAYFRYDSVDYYILITSPQKNAADYYINALLGG